MMLQISTQGVHCQNFGDEIVVINLNAGMYFSLRGGAVPLWEFIQQYPGHDTIQLAKLFLVEGQPDGVENAVKEWIQSGILNPSEAIVPVESPFPTGFPKSIQPIEFEIFDDMKTLLLLDPIHDVDAKVGWPKEK